MKKKLLSLLALLMIGVSGAWAETVVTNPATEMTDGTYITLQCMDTNGGDEYYFNGNAVKSQTLSYANIYKIVSNDADAFYLQRVSDSKYVGNSGNNVSMVDETSSAAAFTFSIATATGWSTYDNTKYTNGTSTVRFTNGSVYLNTRAKDGIPAYAGGTGGYSIWYVKTYTNDEVEALNSVVTYPRVATTVDEIIDGHIYTIRSARNAITWDGSDTKCKGATLDDSNNNNKFVAVKHGTTAGRFYFYNIGAQKFMSKNDNNATLTDVPQAYWTVKAGGNETYPLMLDAQDGNHFNFGGSGQITVDWWATSDDGNRMEFKDFGLADASIITSIKAAYSPKVSTESETIRYAIKNARSNKYAAWTADNTQMEQIETINKNACWYLKDNKLYSAASGKAFAGISSFTDEGATVYVKENPYNPTYFCVSLSENLSSNCWDDNNGKVGNWNPRANDYEGTSWVFEPVSEEQWEYMNHWGTFEIVLNQIKTMNFGNELGQYSIEGYEAAMVNAAIEAYENDLSVQDEEAYEDDMDGMHMMLDNKQLNLPKPGSFLVIKGTTGGKYMNGRALSTDETVMWYGEDNKLITYSTGYGFKNTSEDATLTDEANTQTFSEAQTPGTYFIVSNASGVGQYMYENTNNLDRYSTAAHDRKRWDVAYATTLPVTLSTIGGHNYGTFYTPVGISDLDGVKAYIATEENGKAVMTAIETIPANTAVVLYAKDAAKTSANFTIGEASANTDGNILAGQAATIAKVEGACTLQNNAESGLGFYSYTGTALKGFKAYLNASEHSVKSFALDFDMETAIRGIQEAEEKSAPMYDMSGRRILKAQKGVYIQNGKKYVK